MEVEVEDGMDLFGRFLTGQELMRRVGRLEQVAGVEPLILDDGPARGVRAMRVRTGSGLSVLVLPDRGMDLDAAEYESVPLSWLSPTGVVVPSYYEPYGEGWLRSFHGGLLVTCGLQNVGPPGEISGLHGRISNTPASHVSREARWDQRGCCVLEARGEVRESRVFGANLVLRRTISARLGESLISIEDTVHNEGFEPEPLMLLYHINLGWPLLDETSRLVGPGSGEPPEPRDEEARAGAGDLGPVHGPDARLSRASLLSSPRGRRRRLDRGASREPRAGGRSRLIGKVPARGATGVRAVDHDG
jgi:hypothetical protein